MITVLSGENSFELERALTQIKRSFDGVAESINAEDLKLADLPDILMGVSLFSEKRLVIIRGLSENKTIWSVFADWLDKISDDIQLILIEPKLDKRTTTYKALKAKAEIRDFPVMTDRDLYKVEKWLIDEAKTMSLNLDKKSIQFLINRVGIDQWQLFYALEKLSLFNGAITTDVIAELIPASPSENVFNLFETAISGDRMKLKKLLDSLEQTEDVYRLSALIFSQGFQLAAVSSAGQDDNVAKDFEIHPFVVQKMQPLAKKLGATRVAKIIEILADCDDSLKSSGSDPWLLIENALFKIATI